MMPDWQSAVLGAIGVIVILGLLYLVWTKWLSPSGVQNEDQETQEQLQLEADDVSRVERVGMFERTRNQPVTTKLFYLAVFVLVGVVFVSVYSLMKSGAPSEMKYATQLQQFTFGTIIATAAIWFKSRQDSKAGRLRVVLENDTTSTLEIPFDWEMAEPAAAENEGKDVVLVPAFQKRRLLGLFWRAKLAADDEKAKRLDKARASDRCLYEVPLDDSATWDYRNQTVTARAKRIEGVRDPARAATHTIVPSDRASRGELRQREEEIAELESQIEALERMDAIRGVELEQLEEKLKNIEHGSEQEFQEAVGMVLSLLNALNGQHQSRPTGENGTGEAAAAILEGHQQQSEAQDARSN